jgi:hypothetical protein
MPALELDAVAQRFADACFLDKAFGIVKCLCLGFFYRLAECGDLATHYALQASYDSE